MTTRAAGAGRVTVVGTVPDQALAESLARWLAPEPVGGWACRPPSRSTTSTDAGRAPPARRCTTGAGNPQTVAAPGPLRDLLTGEEVAPGTTVRLGAWDVRVFQPNSQTNGK